MHPGTSGGRDMQAYKQRQRLGRSVGSGVMSVSAEKERLGGDEHTAKASSEA